MIKKAWMPPHPTLFLRKEVYENGHFDTSYKISADYEFILRIFKDQFLKFEYFPKSNNYNATWWNFKWKPQKHFT